MKAKIVISLIFLWIFISCSAEKKNIVKIAEIKQPAPKKIQPEVFNGIIDNFEKFSLWQKKNLDNNFITLRVIKDLEKVSNHIGEIDYRIGYSTEEYKSYVLLELYKKMNFSKYNGVMFTAKGTDNVKFRFKIYEVEEYLPGEKIKEIWYRDFRVSDKWEEYKLPFSSLRVEEYWEQDYVSDNIQVFTNIAGVAITAFNSKTPEFVEGTLYIDNIKLY